MGRCGLLSVLWLGYQKPTRIWGTVRGLDGVLCNKKTCKQIVPGTQRHRESLGGSRKRLGKEMEYRIPPALVEYLLSGPNPSPKQPLQISQLTGVGMIRVDDVVIDETTDNGEAKGPILRVGVVIPDGTVRVLKALLDTGAQCNLIQVGILSPEMCTDRKSVV